MLKIGEQDAVNVLRFFDDLPDPRSKVNAGLVTTSAHVARVFQTANAASRDGYLS